MRPAAVLTLALLAAAGAPACDASPDVRRVPDASAGSDASPPTADAATTDGPIDQRAPDTDAAPLVDATDADAAKVDGLAPDGGCSDKLLWLADHETGDLSQYTAGDTYGGSFDSDCTRPNQGVVSAPEPVFRGQYAMKMTAPITAAKPACRQFRYEESSAGHSGSANAQQLPLYYSLWLRFPAQYQVKDWTNVIQFKAKTFDKSQNDAFWVLELRNRLDSAGIDSMYLMLRYKGIYPGPTAGEDAGLKHYHHDKLAVTVPAAKWFNLTLLLSQSTNAAGQQSNYDGELVIWQDGTEIYRMEDIATRYPDSWNEWSVNVYAPTDGIAVDGKPADFVVHVDDVKISDQPIACP